MTTESLGLDEQIACAEAVGGVVGAAMVASLKRLKAMDEVEGLPEEPECLLLLRDGLNKPDGGIQKLLTYIDTLLDRLKREIARADEWGVRAKKWVVLAGEIRAVNGELRQRAEAAEAIVTKCCEVFDCRLSELTEKTRESKAAERTLATLRDDHAILTAAYENKKTLLESCEISLSERERTLAAMLELGENPSEEIISAGLTAEGHIDDEFKAMFAKLVEQAGVRK